MKKPILLAALTAGVIAVVRRRRNTHADADLWREATAGDRRGAPVVHAPFEGSPSAGA